jgi:hypothetical protein
MIGLGVSLPITRGRIDLTTTGNFYYPLQARDSRTGSALSVSAPFDLDSDRSRLLDNNWNRWLIQEAAGFTIDLLKEDWSSRFEADGFRAVMTNGVASPTGLAEAISKRLSEEECWPTRASGNSKRYAEASSLVLPADRLLDDFLDNARYLHPALQADENVRALAMRSGAKRFTISSLVRLRCAGENGKSLETEIEDGAANIYYSSYATAISNPDRQARMAAALSGLWRRVSKTNRADLRSTPSTLTALGELKSAEDLVLVDPDIWDVCPEPMENRLHPALVSHRAIASLCRRFDEQVWIVDAAARARTGRIGENEREALYKRLLTNEKIGRRALTAIRSSPVTRNHRGEWSAPADMVILRGAEAKLMSPVTSAPSDELLARPDLIARLRIRDRLSHDDILACARSIEERPNVAQRFESFLDKNPRFLTSATVESLRDVSFLRNRVGSLARPSDLHLDTPINRQCLGDDSRIVGGSNEILYRRLQVREHPTVQTLLDLIVASRERSEPPPHIEVFYQALAAALRQDRVTRGQLAGEPILWVTASGYHSPDQVLVGTHIPRVFDQAVPVLRRGDVLAQAYLALGARSEPGDEHWTKLFEHFSGRLDGRDPVGSHERRAIMEVYRLRGAEGLPEALDEDTRCLLDRQGRLFSPSDLRAGLLVEGDYPALVDALVGVGISIGIADVTERSRAFFHSPGIRPLTSIAGAGTPVFGAPTDPPAWFKPHHRDQLINKLRKPLFSRALHELTMRQRYGGTGFHDVGYPELQRRLETITDIEFFDSISREYSVGDQVIGVPVDTAVKDGIIGLVGPRTKLDFRQLIAQSLAEIAGVENVAQARALSTAFVLLVLCRTGEDVRVYLERMGIEMREWSDDRDDQLDLEDDVAEHVGEEIVRQVMESLNTTTRQPEGTTDRSRGGSELASAVAKPSPPTPPPPFELPDLDNVRMLVAPASGQQILVNVAQGGGSYRGWSSGWVPRSATEIERDRDVGRRGEELVYRMELERVRADGHEKPEDLVVWTSQTDAGADHDIRSVGPDGSTRWIEVKSTTGADGRFEWSRKEFEKALREGERYELWRVYEAGSTSPIAKCFANPIGLLGASRLIIELGSLRACVENLD